MYHVANVVFYLSTERVKTNSMWLRERRWAHSLPKCSQVFGISHGRVQPPCPSYVHIEAFACTCTHLDGEKQQDNQTDGKSFTKCYLRQQVPLEVDKLSTDDRLVLKVSKLCMAVAKPCIAAIEEKGQSLRQHKGLIIRAKLKTNGY